MTVCRIVGWIFVATALATITYEAIESVNAGRWDVVTLGDMWRGLHAPSLGLARAAIERNVAPWLWQPAIATALLCPGWIAFGVPGGSMAWLCRRRRRRRYFERRLG